MADRLQKLVSGPSNDANQEQVGDEDKQRLTTITSMNLDIDDLKRQVSELMKQNKTLKSAMVRKKSKSPIVKRKYSDSEG